MDGRRCLRIGMVDDIVDPDLLEAGSRRVLEALVRRLDPDRFQPVALLRGRGRFPDRLRDLGAEVASLEAPRGRDLYRPLGGRALPSPTGFATTAARTPAAVAWYARAFRALRLDAVYVAHPLAHLQAGLAARLAGVPAVLHLQGIAQSSHRVKLALPVYRALVAATGGTVVAISQAVSDAFGGPPAGRPRVIPNGVDTDRFRPAAADPAVFRALNLVRDERPLVGLVGSLEPLKRVHLLPDLARRVRARHPDARFLVAGADLGDPSGLPPGDRRASPSPYVRELLERLQAPDLRDAVVLAGPRGDVPGLMAGMDVLVHLCAVEGFGLVLAEAGAAGVPVVAVGTAGAAEVVEDGRTGLLVADPDDLGGLADRICTLLDDPERRAELGRAARRRVEQRFSEAAFGRAFGALFQELAHR